MSDIQKLSRTDAINKAIDEQKAIYRPVWKDQQGNRIVIPIQGIGGTTEQEALDQQEAVAPFAEIFGLTPDGVKEGVVGTKIKAVPLSAVALGTFLAFEGPAFDNAGEPVEEQQETKALEHSAPVPTLH